MEQLDAFGVAKTIIHFTYQQGEQWRIACMPNMVEFHETPYHKNYQRSNDPRAVTCPSCKKSQALLEAQRGIDAANAART